jgi:hypothetical protein
MDTPAPEEDASEDTTIELPAAQPPTKPETPSEPQSDAPDPATEDSKATTDEALEKLKRAGIGMPRRVQR